MSTDIALARESCVFVKKESTFGSFVFPSATDAVAVLGPPDHKQPESFTESDEVLDSRSLVTRFRDMTPPGEFSFSVYARPSGSAGTPPAEDALMEAVLGTKTVSAGSDVTYKPAKTMPSLSLGIRDGHTCFFISGVVVQSVKGTLEAKGAIRLEFSGSYKKEVKAGTAETVSGSTTSVINLESGGAKRFDVGSFVEVDGDNNGGAGYSVTAVDTSADTITISPALASAPSGGVTVQGYLPNPTIAGEPVQCRTGSVTIAGVSLPVITLEFEVNNNVEMIQDEVTSDSYPSDYIEGKREVTVTPTLYFRKEYLQYFYEARQQTDLVITMGGGDTAGEQVLVTFNQVNLDMPEISGDTARKLAIKGVALASSALEDELSVKYY